jgi:hypothetical protein
MRIVQAGHTRRGRACDQPGNQKDHGHARDHTGCDA